MSSKNRVTELKPLAQQVNSTETVALVKAFAPHGYEAISALGEAARLAKLREQKAAHKEAHAHVYDEQKRFNDEIKDAENRVYAQLAALAQNVSPEEFAEIVNQLPEGLGYQHSNDAVVDLHPDEQAVYDAFLPESDDYIERAKERGKLREQLELKTLLRYCLSDGGSQRYLTVNKRLMIVDALADVEKAYYVPDALFAMPIRIVKAMIPTVSNKLDVETMSAASDAAYKDLIDGERPE